ncbi:MAG TPA: hypothetical protein VL986_05635 [Terracidiphilus sp.]|nr:hypothetical protein [Terracidiphilus sp.]
MRRNGLFAAVIAVFSGLGIVNLVGCGGGSTTGGGGGTSPSISSFGSSPAIVTDGGASSLTGVFANGTGVITPGNISATSGTAVSVTPPNDTTTTYTLTVTGSSGAVVSQTATVQAVAAPSITGFTAGAASITAGGSTTLTATFTNGTGVITATGISAITVNSGMAVTVSPTANTTYTLTVTNAAGTAVTSTAAITVVAAPAITSFTASPTTISSGGSSNLTGVFTGGAGVITGGGSTFNNLTSGTPVSVSPTTTTTYTLTVTNSLGATATLTATVTVSAGPSISSFTAAPASITAGGSASLTGVFAGGTGVVTPGNTTVTSGEALLVNPTATTQYTLTVTPTSGSPVTANATVTVVAAPSITSFTASPGTITAGGSSNLTGVFTGGTGVITAAGISPITVTSGTPVSVSPTTTTTYTLTVTNSLNSKTSSTAMVTVNATGNTTVLVNPSSPGIAVTDKILGMNMAAWFDDVGNASSIQSAFDSAGIQSVRWPGGSWSDGYHWGYQTGSSTLVNPYQCSCSSATSCTANSTAWAGYSTFAEYVNAIPLGGTHNLDLALTANYGTNEACNGGGDPNEAAAWVTAALADGVTPSHMTVGNEEYGSWETDLHAKPNDPTTYAGAVTGTNGYYSLIKTASPNTRVGIDVDASSSWDSTVMSNAAGYYDFVEFHYYPETPGQESDTFITHSAAQELTSNINTLKTELSNAGEAGTPIYVGEIGGPYSNPGKQSVSITQGLYAGQVLGEMMNDGVSRLTWWIGFGNCNGQSGNDSSSVYGWQDFGAYNVFSDGPTLDPTCTGYGSIGTMSPTAEAFNLFQNVAVSGEHVLTPTVNGDTTDVRAYAATHSGGTALVLFNVNETTSETVTLTVNGESNSNDVKVITYDKEIYDYTDTTCQTDPTCTYDSTHNYATVDWAPPTTTDMGSQSIPLTLTLAPWSMNVVLIQ